MYRCEVKYLVQPGIEMSSNGLIIIIRNSYEVHRIVVPLLEGVRCGVLQDNVGYFISSPWLGYIR